VTADNETGAYTADVSITRSTTFVAKSGNATSPRPGLRSSA
jgi:hypothetical protein